MGENEGRCIHCVYRRIECSATCVYKSVFPVSSGRRGVEGFLMLYQCYKKGFLEEGLSKYEKHENCEVYKREFINGLIYACEARNHDPNGGAAAVYWKIHEEINRSAKLYERLMVGYPVKPTHREDRRSVSGLEDRNIWHSITHQFGPVTIKSYKYGLHVHEVHIKDGMEVKKGQPLFSIEANDNKDGTSLRDLTPFCISALLKLELFYNDNCGFGLIDNRNRMALIGTGTDQYRAEQLKIKEKVLLAKLYAEPKKRKAEQPCERDIITAHKTYRVTKVHVRPGYYDLTGNDLFSFESVLEEGGIRIRFNDCVYKRFDSSFQKYSSVYQWHLSTMNKIWNFQDQPAFDVRECWKNIKEFDCFNDIPLPDHILSVESTSNQKTGPSEKGTPFRAPQ